MSGRSTTITKEARALFWPWCAVIFAAMASSLLAGSTGINEIVVRSAFWIGASLLASLSLGVEFHGRTLSLLLSQPVDRMKVWNIKWIVLVVAVLSTAAVYASSPGTVPFSIFAAALLFVTVCSSPYWTLVAKSTIGGFVLNMLQIVILNFVHLFLEGLAGPKASIAFTLVASGYGFLMLWLGRRKFASLEVTEAIGSDALLLRDWSIIRPRPTGVFLNLIRKEVQLLWPVWLLTMFCAMLLGALGIFQIAAGSERVPQIAVVVVILYGAMALLLAGAASMGEERVLRTHTWHLTLPMSPDLQWAVKLIASVLAGAACVWLVALEARWIFGQAFTDLLDGSISPSLTDRLLLLSGLSLVGFWCACGVNGTVRAALWAVPAVCAFAIANRLLLELPHALSYTSAMAFFVRKFHTFSFHYDVYLFLINRARGLAMPLLFAFPPLLCALFQSRRAFRMEVQDNVLSTIRYLVKPTLFTFLFLFPIMLLHSFAMESWWEGTSVVSNVHRNIRSLKLDLTGTDESHPRHLTDKEMTAVVTSDAAQAWLRGATIDVFAGSTQKVFRGAENLPWVRDLMSITIRMANGSECKATGYFSTRTAQWSPAFARCDPM